MAAKNLSKIIDNNLWMTDDLPLQQALEIRSIAITNTRIKATVEEAITVILNRRLGIPRASASFVSSIKAEIHKMNQSIYPERLTQFFNFLHSSFYLSNERNLTFL